MRRDGRRYSGWRRAGDVEGAIAARRNPAVRWASGTLGRHYDLKIIERNTTIPKEKPDILDRGGQSTLG